MKKLIYELCFGALILIIGINTMTYVFSLTSDIYLKDQISNLINADDKGLDVEYTLDEVDSSMFEIDNMLIDYGDEFDYHDYVHIYTRGMIDLSSYVSMEGEVDTLRSGEYPVRFYLRWNGIYLAKSATVYVKGNPDLYKIYGKAKTGDKLTLLSESADLVMTLILDTDDFVIENLASGRYELFINEMPVEFEIINENLDLGEL